MITFSRHAGDFEAIGSEPQASDGFLSPPGENAFGAGAAGAVMNAVGSIEDVGPTRDPKNGSLW